MNGPNTTHQTHVTNPRPVPSHRSPPPTDLNPILRSSIFKFKLSFNLKFMSLSYTVGSTRSPHCILYGTLYTNLNLSHWHLHVIISLSFFLSFFLFIFVLLPRPSPFFKKKKIEKGLGCMYPFTSTFIGGKANKFLPLFLPSLSSLSLLHLYVSIYLNPFLVYY